MTIAEKYNIKTTIDAERQNYYNDLSELELEKFVRYAKFGGCEKTIGRFIINLYNKKFLDRPYIKLNKYN
jgi:hypothetical protein